MLLGCHQWCHSLSTCQAPTHSTRSTLGVWTGIPAEKNPFSDSKIAFEHKNTAGLPPYLSNNPLRVSSLLISLRLIMICRRASAPLSANLNLGTRRSPAKCPRFSGVFGISLELVAHWHLPVGTKILTFVLFNRTVSSRTFFSLCAQPRPHGPRLQESAE